MVLRLTCKDFLIARRYFLIMLIACPLIPILFAKESSIGPLSGVMSLLVMSVFVVFMCLLELTRKEAEYHEAMALLCAAPYPRAHVVVSTYLFAFVLGGTAWAIYGVESLFFPVLRNVSPLAFSSVFLIVAVLISIYLPFLYKFGYDKTRMGFFVLILVTPFLTAQLGQSLGQSTVVLAAIEASDSPLTAVFWAIGIAAICISLPLSIRLFRNADLA